MRDTLSTILILGLSERVAYCLHAITNDTMLERVRRGSRLGGGGWRTPTPFCASFFKKGFVYSADADGRRDTCVFGRRVYSADGKFTIYIVDLVIFACLDFREFVICGLFSFTKYKIR